MKTLDLAYKTTILALMYKSHLLWHMGNDSGIIDVIITDQLEIGKTHNDIFRIDFQRNIPGVKEPIRETFAIAFRGEEKLLPLEIEYRKLDTIDMFACYHIDRFGRCYLFDEEVSPEVEKYHAVHPDELFDILIEFLDAVQATQLPYVHQNWERIKDTVYAQDIGFLYDAASQVEKRQIPPSQMLEQEALAKIVFDAVRDTNTYTGEQDTYLVDRKGTYQISMK